MQQECRGTLGDQQPAAGISPAGCGNFRRSPPAECEKPDLQTSVRRYASCTGIRRTTSGHISVVFGAEFQGAGMDQPVPRKAVGTHGSAGRHRLVRVAALLLLLTHQAAAGVVCVCKQEFATRPADGLAARHPAAPVHLCRSEPDEGGMVAGNGAASVEEQSGMPIRMTGSCRQVQAQPKPKAASAADPTPLPAFTPSTLAFEDAVSESVHPTTAGRYPRRSRPLYITQSSYRI